MTERLPKILIAVPTCLRPVMLSECLQSIARLRLPPEVDVGLVVADNDVRESAREVVEQFATTAPFPVAYTVAPERGLCNVRNHLLECAIARDADYMACIDDDDTATESWLVELYKAMLKTGVDAVQGGGGQPEDPPRRAVRLGTENLMISSRIYKDMNIRFDPALNLIGYEDLDFFKRAHEAGAVLLLVPGPATHHLNEHVKRPEWKVYLKHKFDRHSGYQWFLRKHRGKIAARVAISALTYLIKGLLLLIPAIFSKKQLERCLVSFTKSAAYTYSLFGGKGEPYKHIVGN